MTFLAFTGLINAIASFTLGTFGYYKNPNSPASKAYLNINLTTALYSVGYFFWQISRTTESQVFWFKILVLGFMLINPAFLHFVFAFTGKINKKKAALLIIYSLTAIFIGLNFTSLLYLGFIPKHSLGLWPVPSIFFNVFLGFWFFQVLYGFRYFLIGFRENVGLKREQIKYCILAGFIGFLGGISNWPMWYGIKFPPYPNILITLYVFIVAYVIIKHQLLDIEVVIRKTLVFAGLFAFLFGIIVSIAILTQEFIAQYIPHSRYFGLAMSAIIIILLHNPAYNFLVNVTNKYLFQKKYDLGKVFKDFADEALTILNLDRVCKVTVDTLVKNLYLTNCGILLLTKDESSYELHHSIGLVDTKSRFKAEDSIIVYIKKDRNPILYESYDKYFQASEDIKKDMDKIKSKLMIPLVIHDQLVGVLSLGAKKSDEAYTSDDMDILTTLVRAVSIAISNARLFTQAAQYEKLAAIGTLASGINHEVCNPLNNISMKMQLFSESRKRGLYKDKKPNEIIDEAEEIMEYSVKEIQRVAGITSKLSGFAKPSKERAPVAINILAAVDDALDVVGHELTMNKIKIIKNIPEDLPRILADQHQIQQIFFNLIRNAAQAIKEEGSVTIDTEEFKDKIDIKIIDTGSGIPKDKLKKIFEPFFTTKAKGSGFGLSIVRELVWRNNGTISVDSEIGKGTTFYLEFQKAE